MESTIKTLFHHSANTHNTSPQLEGVAITDYHAIPTSLCSRTQAKKAILRQPIFLTDADYDCILEEIGGWDKIEIGREIDVYSDDMEDSWGHFK